MAKVKGCPFCESKKIEKDFIFAGAKCLNCGARTFEHSKDNIEIGWNSRPREQRLEVLLKEVDFQLNNYPGTDRLFKGLIQKIRSELEQKNGS